MDTGNIFDRSQFRRCRKKTCGMTILTEPEDRKIKRQEFFDFSVPGNSVIFKKSFKAYYTATRPAKNISQKSIISSSVSRGVTSFICRDHCDLFPWNISVC